DFQHRCCRIGTDAAAADRLQDAARHRAGAAAEIKQRPGADAAREVEVEIGAAVPTVLIVVEDGEFGLVVVVTHVCTNSMMQPLATSGGTRQPLPVFSTGTWRSFRKSRQRFLSATSIFIAATQGRSCSGKGSSAS